MNPIDEAYAEFRRYDHKRRIVVREYLFDFLVEVFALFLGVNEARPPTDEQLDRLESELRARTFDSLQAARDRVTMMGLRALRSEALPVELMLALQGTDVRTPGELITALKERSLPEEQLRAVLDYFDLQKRGGRKPKKKKEGEVEDGGST